MPRQEGVVGAAVRSQRRHGPQEARKPCGKVAFQVETEQPLKLPAPLAQWHAEEMTDRQRANHEQESRNEPLRLHKGAGHRPFAFHQMRSANLTSARLK